MFEFFETVKLHVLRVDLMKVITVGSRVFVTSFQLAGVQGKIVDSPEDAFEEIKKLYNDSDVGLVLVSDDLTEKINDQLTKLRAEQSPPLVFALPASGSENLRSTIESCSKKSSAYKYRENHYLT